MRNKTKLRKNAIFLLNKLKSYMPLVQIFVNNHVRIPSGQSKMDFAETQPTLGTQYERNKTKQKHNKIQHRKLKRRETRPRQTFIFTYIQLLVEGLISYCGFYCVCLRIVMSNILSYEISLRSEFHRIKRCSVRLYLSLFVGGLMSYLRQLCLLAHSGFQHILCCVFVLLFCFCLRLAYPMFPDSLDFLMALRYFLTLKL